jgi:hypothetical protein
MRTARCAAFRRLGVRAGARRGAQRERDVEREDPLRGVVGVA